MTAPAFSTASSEKTSRLEATEKRFLSFLIFLSLIVGLLYLFAVRPGTPYDEPAHYNAVELYRASLRLPVLGETGAMYEVYQPPVYYVLASFAARAVGSADAKTVFYLVRFFSLLLFLPCIALVYLIARELNGPKRLLTAACAVFVALNPSLLAIVSSVENDGLAILLCLLTTYLSIQWIAKSELTLRRTVWLAALVSLAILTKLNTCFLAVCMPVFFWRFQRARALRYSGVFIGVVAALTLWWFLRNILIYGDLTAEKAMRRVLPAAQNWVKFNPLRPGDYFHLLRSLVTYWWLPVEYFRNAIHAPKWTVVAVGLLTLLGLGGGAAWAAQQRRADRADTTARRAGWMLAVQYGVYMLVYLQASILVWTVPARITLVCLMVPALAIGGGGLHACSRLGASGGKSFVAALAVCLLLMNASLLRAVSYAPVGSYNLFVTAAPATRPPAPTP